MTEKKLSKRELKAKQFKEKKTKAPSESLPEKPIEEERATIEDEVSTEKPVPPTRKRKGQEEPKTKKRFILFAGAVASVRLLMNKETKKCKGFAFVEFSDAASLQNALKMNQQSFMGRKINVELTAGGGGASTARKEKIKEKNKKMKQDSQPSA